MIKIQSKQGEVEMSITEFTRWMCLIEAFDFISKRSEEMEIPYPSMIKPAAIEKYISERYISMLHDVTVEHRLGNV